MRNLVFVLGIAVVGTAGGLAEMMFDWQGVALVLLEGVGMWLVMMAVDA